MRAPFLQFVAVGWSLPLYLYAYSPAVPVSWRSTAGWHDSYRVLYGSGVPFWRSDDYGRVLPVWFAFLPATLDSKGDWRLALFGL